MTESVYLAAQNPGIPLAAVAVAGLVNVLGDFVSVQLLGWGIAGAAWATVLAQVTAPRTCHPYAPKTSFAQVLCAAQALCAAGARHDEAYHMAFAQRGQEDVLSCTRWPAMPSWSCLHALHPVSATLCMDHELH